LIDLLILSFCLLRECQAPGFQDYILLANMKNIYIAFQLWTVMRKCSQVRGRARLRAQGRACVPRGTGMRACGGLSEKLTLSIALWQTIENAQHFLAGEAAATFFFLLNISDLVRID